MFLPALLDIYVCEQLPSANSSPIVSRLGQSYPWPQGTKWLNFGRSKVKVAGAGMCRSSWCYWHSWYLVWCVGDVVGCGGCDRRVCWWCSWVRRMLPVWSWLLALWVTLICHRLRSSTVALLLRWCHTWLMATSRNATLNFASSCVYSLACQ